MSSGQKGPSSRQTFTKADRLLQRSEFLHLAKFGQRFQNRYFIAQVCKNESTRSRLGITITRKVAKASVRNRLKRLAREYFRKNRQVLQGSWDINIIAKKEAADLTNKNAVSALESLFLQIEQRQKN